MILHEISTRYPNTTNHGMRYEIVVSDLVIRGAVTCHFVVWKRETRRFGESEFFLCVCVGLFMWRTGGEVSDHS